MNKQKDNIINGNCWIAYFDILGFSNLVENFPVDYVCKKYKEAIEKGKEHSITCRFKYFSDSFIFYVKANSQDSFYGISNASTFFFEAMFHKEIPLRGCLHFGHFYIDENNNVFFGKALIDTYRWAEQQNWIGFVLSDEARQKSSGFSDFHDFWFQEYDVPYKDSKIRKLHTHYPNILLFESSREPSEYYHTRLLNTLDSMKQKADLIYKKNNPIVDTSKCHNYTKLMMKYKNTKDFFESAYEPLRKRFEQRFL